jgi:hypothetical protein
MPIWVSLLPAYQALDLPHAALGVLGKFLPIGMHVIEKQRHAGIAGECDSHLRQRVLPTASGRLRGDAPAIRLIIFTVLLIARDLHRRARISP